MMLSIWQLGIFQLDIKYNFLYNKLFLDKTTDEEERYIHRLAFE